MPPRPSLTSSFSVSDANNEVVCPLTNNDGSNCRKRCLGEKRYRSMQEHIRRAHPNHYIPKLPATEESFQLMVNTPPDQRPNPPPQTTNTAPHSRRGQNNISDKDLIGGDQLISSIPRTLDEAHPAAATAAVALAQLHHHRLNSDWDSEALTDPEIQDAPSDTDLRRERMRSSIELPPLRDHLNQDALPSFNSPRPREILPSILSHSPPGRSSTLPPIHRRDKIQRPRKGSLTQTARKAKHERNRSKEFGRRPSLKERKALSAEPQTAAWVQGKRWEDLIEAATSATEVDDDRDITPVPQSPSFRSLASITSAPSAMKHRSSLPPAFQSTPGLPTSQPSYRQFPQLSYAASPLQKALTPPPYEHRAPDTDLEPFPSIESSLDSMSTTSGKNFHMAPTGLPTSANSDSSPIQPSRPLTSYPPSSHPYQFSHPLYRPHHRLSNPTPFSSITKDVQIYCSSCSRPWPIRECVACTECISGVCRECISSIADIPLGGMGGPVSILNPTSSPGNGINRNTNGGDVSQIHHSRKGCPRCGMIGGKWRAFQLEFR
ncbi:hypothetical protein FQN57_002665 [Myotisia sp. PD_48]|nr:hypothetical protein FQN57_002665 [Myotisia sp. PD_48]